jgi:transposase-like protein
VVLPIPGHRQARHTPVDFLLTAKRDLEATKRFFHKMLKDQPLLAPDRIGTDGAGPYPPAIAAAWKNGLPPQDPLHYISKHLQQGIERDPFRVKRPMLRIGGFQSFRTVDIIPRAAYARVCDKPLHGPHHRGRHHRDRE